MISVITPFILYYDKRFGLSFGYTSGTQTLEELTLLEMLSKLHWYSEPSVIKIETLLDEWWHIDVYVCVTYIGNMF